MQLKVEVGDELILDLNPLWAGVEVESTEKTIYGTKVSAAYAIFPER